MGGIGLVILVAALLSGSGFFHPMVALSAFVFLNGGFKYFAATQASFAFAKDREYNLLDLLLSTPTSPQHLVDGQITALRVTIRPWVRRLLVWEACWLIFCIVLHASAGWGETLVYICAGAALLALFVPDLYAVVWLALWQGVISKDSRQAENASLSVLILPWALMPVVSGLLALFSIGETTRMFAALVAWAASSFVCNRLYSRGARRHLEMHLRHCALARACGEDDGFYAGWQRLGRWAGKLWRRLVR